jgi:hypothetical protein
MKTPDRFGHPVRAAIMEALEWIGEPCSSLSLARCLDTHPAVANYHVRILVGRGVLTRAGTALRRNAREQLWRIA